jgi:ABC-type glutathione transport system ATPase component
MSSAPEFVLEVRGLSKTYTQGKWWQRKFHCSALDNVSLALRPGTTLALVGASGCGKTTLAMCIVGLESTDAGEILVNDVSIGSLDKRAQRLARAEIQLVFQDSAGALSPRMSAIQIVEEPLLIRRGHSRAERLEVASEMMERVGISSNWMQRLPHEFSGGQRQRLAIARALVLRPRILILDEVFVGLDLSIQGQIANLLLDLQQTEGLSYICISHDLAIAVHIADTIALMDQGRIVESGTPEEFFKHPGHPVTVALASALRPTRSAMGAHAGV